MILAIATMLLTLAFAQAPATAHDQTGSHDYAVTAYNTPVFATIVDVGDPFLTGECIFIGGVYFDENGNCPNLPAEKQISTIHDPGAFPTRDVDGDQVPFAQFRLAIEDDVGTDVIGSFDVRGANGWNDWRYFCGSFDSADTDRVYTFPAPTAPKYPGGESNFIIVWVGGPTEQVYSAATVVDPTCELASTGGTTGTVELTLYH